MTSKIANFLCELKTSAHEVYKSALRPRGDSCNEKASQINKEIRVLCNRCHILLCGNSNLKPHVYLQQSKWHLNNRSTRIL